MAAKYDPLELIESLYSEDGPYGSRYCDAIIEDNRLDEIADDLRSLMAEVGRRQIEQARQEQAPVYKFIPSEMQDELFIRHRQEMLDRAAAHERFMQAMNSLYAAAQRKHRPR